MYLDIDDSGELAVYIEETDDCYTCSNVKKCPFIEALQVEVVIPRYENISIKDCKLFKESKVNDKTFRAIKGLFRFTYLDFWTLKERKRL